MSRSKSQISSASGCGLHGAALAETLDGGQCFRWNRAADGAWHGVSGACAAVVHETPAGGQPSVVAGTPEALRWHLAGDLNWPALADQLPWRTDAHLARCIAAFPGLRILRQPIGEALLCFMCSAAKQINQIKQMAELLATRFGQTLTLLPPATPATTPEDCHPLVDNDSDPGAGVRPPRGEDAPLGCTSPPVRPFGQCHPLVDNSRGRDAERSPASRNPTGCSMPEALGDIAVLHALPTWEKLAAATEADLRACKLGFRARHVRAVAQQLAEQPAWLAETAALPYAEAKTRLVTLPGVGEKIADCVLLFGAGKLEAFPVDVWILRALARRYRLDGWRPVQVAQFGRSHFGPLAGLAQQFLFAWERRHGDDDQSSPRTTT